MNLGNRRIKNEELRAAFEALGFEDVATFRASGNVAFDAGDEKDEGTLTERLEVGLEQNLGYAVPVFLRSCAEVRRIAGREPVPAAVQAKSGGKLQVSLLGAKPSATARRQALALASDEDLLAIDGTELYWLPSGGISESDLDLKAIAALLGPDTMRTIGTIEQIAAKYCGG